MPLTKIAMWGYYCQRCGHRWVPRGLEQSHRATGDEKRLKASEVGDKPDEPAEEPRVCPLCKSPYWNRPKER